MTDEALRRDQPDSSGNLSNVPLHMADVGTENYDQEFTLGLIENEQGTLEQVHEALDRIDAGTFGRCQECGEPIAKPRLQALPYTRHCIQCARELESRRMTRAGRPGAAGSSSGPSPWGGRLRPGDQGAGLRAGRPAAGPARHARSRTSSSCTPATTRAPSGASAATALQQPDLRRRSRSSPRSSICYWLFVRGAATDRRLTTALGLIMAGALGNCYDRLVFGHVRDFVHFHVDPIGFDCAIFNFADNMLVAGAIALMLLAVLPTTDESGRPSARSRTPSRPPPPGSCVPTVASRDR